VMRHLFEEDAGGAGNDRDADGPGPGR